MVVFKAADIAKKIQGTLVGDQSLEIYGPADLVTAKSGEISFLANPKYTKYLNTTNASAVVVSRQQKVVREGLTCILVDNPNSAFSTIIEMFAPNHTDLPPGIHPAAVISPQAKVAKNVRVGPCAVVCEYAEIGAGTQLLAGAYIGPHVKIGTQCFIGPNVSVLEQSIIGNRVILQAGTVIGSDGFGYEMVKGQWQAIPQKGKVIIGDDVHIGANCTVDRARFGITRLERGVKLDNLVHVAHNVVVGENSLLVAQVGISGSSKLGKYVMVGGQVGIGGHLSIGDGAQIAGQSGITDDVSPGAQMWGCPAMDFTEYIKATHRIKKLGSMLEQLRALQKQVADLEGKLEGQA